MKEFLFGVLFAIWVVILGFSTLSTLFALLTILYPLGIGFMIMNYQFLRRLLKGHKKKRISL